jgi:D-aspartate ligase
MNLHMLGAALPPALLTMANYNGTLAAVRALGRSGVRVTTADPNRLAVSKWSRHTTTRVRCPHVRDANRFIAWLLEFGRRYGEHVLLPTNDDTAWLYALHREALSRYFYLPSASIEPIYRLLNKRTLYEEARGVGLNVPRTWFPESPDDLARCGLEANFPVIVKPRTQVMFHTQSKGTVVELAEELAPRYAAFSQETHAHALLAIDPSAGRPMVQEYFPHAAKGIYNISGFVHGGRITGARGARKLLQQPRQLGVGVCFEEAQVASDLTAGLERLVARVGYSGVFEAEFILSANDAFLIDFNPRFYNQMAFDIDRGLSLPTLAYLEALGDDSVVDEACESLDHQDEQNSRVFIDPLTLHTLLVAQRLSGALSAADQRYWKDWCEHHRGTSTFAVRDKSDKVPALLAAMHYVVAQGRHPRKFVTSTVLNRS